METPKYVKAQVDYPLEGLEMTKKHLQPVPESIWAKLSPDGKSLILQNHAVGLYPFESWGMIIPRTTYDLLELPENRVVHPEAWDAMIEAKIIDEEGNYIKDLNSSHEQATTT